MGGTGGLRTALPAAGRRAGARWGGPGAAGAGGRGAVVRRGARGPAAVALAAALVAGAGGACAPAAGSPAGGAPTLYVANSVDGTVARLDGDTGRPLGPPLAAGPGPGRQGRRLYAVEHLSGPEDDPPQAAGARLLGLHPTTLEVESERLLDVAPTRLVVAPEGDAAYALHDHRLTRLGLDGGPDRSLALPEPGLALAVTRDRVYVSSASGPELWAFRRRDGRLVATLRVGASAADLLVSPAG